MLIIKFNKIILFAICIFFMNIGFAYSQNSNSGWKPVAGHIMSKWAKDVSPENVLPEYPRPQMVRKQWKSLNGLWDYAILPKDEKQPSNFDGKILVPFPIESALSGVGKKVGENDRLWYKTTFEIPEGWNGQNIVLHFEAVDWDTKVSVNGHLLGEHKGGYDHFAYDITPYLNKTGQQEVVVSVWDPTDKGFQPRGKQAQNPGGIMYTSVTGIWQTVWIEPVPEIYIGSIKIIPNIDNGIVQVSANCVGLSHTYYQLEGIVFNGDKEISEGKWSIGGAADITVPDEKLWSPDSPYLYGLKIILRNKEGEILDSVRSYFGMRKISIGKDSEGIERIMLNNKFVFEQGVLDQGWWPDGLYTAPSDKALKSDIEMIKKMGFNLARKHVKVEPERWYYWCDKLGLLVWQDMPSGDSTISPGQTDIHKSQESADDFTEELTQMINQHIDHPSIIVWVPFNEGWGEWRAVRVAKYIKYLDPSRLVDQSSGWVDRGAGDIHDIHSYPGPEMPKLEDTRAVALGEFGGLGYTIKGHTWKEEDNWGYINFKKISQLQDAYSNLIYKLMLLKKKGLSAAVYTQLTDVEAEVNGLMTYDRDSVKMGVDFLAKINAGYLPPVIISKNSIFLDKLKVELNDPSKTGIIKYTIDGSVPSITSMIYTKPLILNRTTTVKSITFWSNGSASSISEKEFLKTKLTQSIKKVKNLIKGLNYNYYENNGNPWSTLQDFNNLKPVVSGITGKINLNLAKRENNFELTFSGFILIKQNGVYTFYLNSDDGSNLYIGDTLLIDNNNVHGMIEKSGEIALSRGYYPIRINYFQGIGGSGLKVDMKAPGMRKNEIPQNLLFHKKN